MNSDLKNKVYTCPDNIIKQLNINLNIYNGDEHSKGHKRAKDIVNNPKLPQSKMVKLKHDLANFEGHEDEFILIGGNSMRDWVNGVLQQAMDSISTEKEAKMRGGLQNTHIKPHEKDKANKNVMDTSLDQSNSVTKSNNKTVYDEEIKQVKYLIEYLDNNKNKIL